MSPTLEELYELYPWLKITTTLEEYIEPEYYEKLLKNYVFNGKKDTQIFKEFLMQLKLKKPINAIELGCGSGRVTEIFLNSLEDKDFELDLVDLSKRMLTFCKNKFQSHKNINFIESDSIKFLEKTEEIYDVIFSMWSFSHSVHQILIKEGLDRGRDYVKRIIRKMVEKNMGPSSEFFLIHFDSLSDEQKILLRQWSKVFPIYSNLDIQSPSQILIEEVLEELQIDGTIELKKDNLQGEEIVYDSLEEALEVYLNFHMESFFNQSPFLPEVVSDLKEYLEKFRDEKGKVRIKPRCFIYLIRKKIKHLINDEDISNMDYNQIIGVVKETNRPPGGKNSVFEIVNRTNLTRDKKVLEIGASTGFTAIELSRLVKCDITSIDINEESLDEAKNRAKEEGYNNIIFKKVDVNSLPFEDESFDLVIIGNVFSLLSDKKKALNECMRVCRKDGFIAAIPMYYVKTPSEELIKKVSNAIKVNIIPMYHQDWREFFSYPGLEIYWEKDYIFDYVSDESVKEFCDTILNRDHLRQLNQSTLDRLRNIYPEYMFLFRDNLSHMGYSILLLARRKIWEDPELYTSKEAR